MKKICKSLAALFSLLLIMNCFWSCKPTVIPPLEEYTITYVLNGGTNSTENPASYTVESETITLKEPTKEGYIFAGWYETKTFEGNPTTEISKGSTGNKTFYARWTKGLYKITYELNGGTNNVDNLIQYTVEDDTITLKEPTRAGYTFAGWFESADFSGTAAIGIAKGSTGNKTFYAKWNMLTYTITYVLNYGTNSTDNPASYTVESETITLKEPTRAGCVFIGWYETKNFDGKPTTEIAKGTTGDKTLYARWRLVVVTRSNVGNAITELKDLEDGTYTIKVTGYLTDKDIDTIRDALITLQTNNPNIFVDLDLSGTTDLTSIEQKNLLNPITGQFIGRYEGLSGCTNLVSVKLPDSVTSIGYGAFSGCKSLASIDIPDKVTSIEGSAFYGCKSLASIDIPDGVTSIGNTAFSGCTSIRFTVDEGNANYKASGDGFMLLSKDGTTLCAANGASGDVSIPEGVTSIENSAFQQCTSLASIVIPDSVTSIGNFAFSYCSSLESIVIPDKVTSIRDDTFYGCTSLASIVIPDSVTSIGNDAFYGCTSIRFTVDEGNANYKASDDGFMLLSKDGKTLYSANGVSGDVSIPEDVTTIGSSAFHGCKSLESIVIPEGVTSIGSSAFRDCTSLASVTVKAETPPTLATDRFIPLTYAFDNNKSGRKIYVPKSSVDTYKAAKGWSKYADSITAMSISITEDNAATKIEALKASGAGTYTLKATGTFSSTNSITTALNTLNDDKENPSIFIDLDFSDTTIDITAWSFYEAEYLHEIILPKNITSIEAGTFCKCANLTTVDIPATVTSIGANAFDGCTKLENITIPSGVTSIGTCAFVNCESIKTIEIPEGVTTIAANAFNHCPSISAITIPSSVTTIEDYAFCASSYQSITIPEKVTSIGTGAFQWCANLKTVTVNATTPPTLGSDAFADNESGRKIYVPKSSVDAYKTAWSAYADDIMAIE